MIVHRIINPTEITRLADVYGWLDGHDVQLVYVTTLDTKVDIILIARLEDLAKEIWRDDGSTSEKRSSAHA